MTVEDRRCHPHDALTPGAPTRSAVAARRRYLAVAACLAPLFLGNYALHAIIIALIFLLPAHGLNLLVGYTGLLSLAQAAFFGIGAYASGLMAVHFGTPFYLNFLVAGLLAGAGRLASRHSGARLRATSFVMCTLGFVIIGQAIAKNWIGLTRGDMGLSGIPKPYFALGPASFTISGTTSFYYLVLVIAAIATLGVVSDRAIGGRPQHGGDPRERDAGRIRRRSDLALQARGVHDQRGLCRRRAEASMRTI